jgi:hypothetical protein
VSQTGEEPGLHSVAAMQVVSSAEGGGKFHLQMHFLRMGSQTGISSTVQPVVRHLFAGTGVVSLPFPKMTIEWS